MTHRGDGTMLAIVSHRPGGPGTLSLECVAREAPARDEVLIDVSHAAVNHLDLLIIEDRYQFRPRRPFAPGAELAGTVREIGAAVTGVQPSMRVMAFPFFGAFAEQARVPASLLLPIPPDMDFETAAAFPLTYSTAMHALRDRAAIQRGETLLVLGAAGGVGLAAVQIGLALGARVIAAAAGDVRLDVCRRYGAHLLLDYERQDVRARLADITNGAGVDVVCDMVGGRWSEAIVKSLSWQGRYVIVGFSSGDIPKLPLNLVLLKNCSVIGLLIGEFMKHRPADFASNWETLIEWWRAGLVRPHIDGVSDLLHTSRVLTRLAQRQVVGKSLIAINPSAP